MSKKMHKVCVDVNDLLYQKLRFYFPKHTGFSDKMRGAFTVMVDREERRRKDLGLETFVAEESDRNDG